MSWKGFISRLLGGNGSPEKKEPVSLPRQIKVDVPNTISQGTGVPQSSTQHETRIPGHLTQYPGVDESAPKSLLVIGLDFGTAFTKVVIGGITSKWAVPFDSFINDEGNRFLLPGVLGTDESGACFLGNGNSYTNAVSDLKMRLLQGDFSEEACVHATAYLALVMQHTRSWFLNEHKSIYKTRRLEWNINVGLPTDNYHDNDLLGVYQRIVIAAWRVSISDEPVTLELSSSVYKSALESDFHGDALSEDDLHPDLVGLFPEFAAQVTGYVKSSLRRSDLHALIDIGAGTVDFTVFNVHENDGEERFPIFARDVQPLGSQYLVMHRLEKVNYDGAWKPTPHDPPLTTSEFSIKVGVAPPSLNSVDRDFVSKLSSLVLRSLRYTKTHRHPRSAHWRDGIPLFVCGGGSKVDVYDEFCSNLSSNGFAFPIDRMTLPRPANLVADRLDDESFDRLSVAYGLAIDALDMVEVIRQNEIEDQQLGARGNEDSHTICPLCSGTGAGYGNCRRCDGRGYL